MRGICEVCGKEFEAKRADKKTCGPTCRSRKSTNPRLAEVRALPAAPPPTGGVLARTAARIAELELDDDPQAAVALVLAKRLDSDAETGAAVASLARQYTLVMDDLAKRGKRHDDQLDEITARILNKAHA